VSNGNQPPLSSCGCCQGLPPLDPETNNPGLSAISYRFGSYATLFERMLAQIQSPNSMFDPPPASIPWVLSALSTRSPDDPAIAFIDAWAVVADVLTFYQERIANEGFLRTATERQSVLQLAREIGYELSPGVAASVYLAFTVEDVVGTGIVAPLPQTPKTPNAPTQGAQTFNLGAVTIPQGTKAQSIPAQGQLPQTFETSADLAARAQWNSLLPRLTRPADLALTGDGQLYMVAVRAEFSPSAGASSVPSSSVYLLNPDTPALTTPNVDVLPIQQMYLAGNNTGIQQGDRLLLVGKNSSGSVMALPFVVQDVTVLSSQSQTRIDFGPNPADIAFVPFDFPGASITANPVPFDQQNVNANVLAASIDESDLRALIQTSNWDPGQLTALVNNLPSTLDPIDGVFSFQAKAGFFGNSAPKWDSLPVATSTRGTPYPTSWDSFNDNAGPFIWTDSQGNRYTDASAHLERSLPEVVPNSWTILESKTVPATPYLISDVLQKSLADYGISGKSTGLLLPISEFIGSAGFGLGAPSAVSWNPSRVDVFAIGADGNLYHKANIGAWSPSLFGWDNLGGPGGFGGWLTYVGTPCAITGGAGIIDIFALGSDGNLYYVSGDGNLWSAPVSLGSPSGGFASSPSAVAGLFVSGNLDDVFAIGADGNLYHIWFDGFSWQGPVSFGPNSGNFTGNPVAVAGGPNGLDVFVIDSNGALNHLWQGDVTTDTFPGGFQGSPGAVSWGPARVDVFAIDGFGNLFHAWAEGVGPSTPWGSEYFGDGFWTGSPTAVSSAPNRIDVFGIVFPSDLRHFWWDGQAWQGPEDLGGDQDLLSLAPSAVVRQGRIDVFATSFDFGMFHFADMEFLVRTTTAYLQSQQQTLVEFPVTDDIPAQSTSLMVNGLVLGLSPEQALAVNGMRSDAPGVLANEIVILQDIVHNGGFTTLEFTTGLQFGYKRATLTLNANTVGATHGSTVAVPEVLGSGNAAQANQSFTLKQSPLTYVSAPTASGAESTLEVRVNNLLWNEAPTLFGLGPNDQSYIVRRADDGTNTVSMGDGAVGARIPTGQNNVVANYRTGIGTTGDVTAGSLSILQSRPPGVRAVTNPLDASGGADPENLDHSRQNAPLTVLTLDRIVSLEDYEDFAAAFAGVGKAQAIPFWDGETGFVHLTIAGIEGATVDPTSQLYLSLTGAIDTARDPVQQVRVSSYRPMTFNLVATVIIDKPRYVPADVLAAINTALLSTFSFDQRAFAQPVTAAEVITAVQAIPGVIATDLTQLYRSDDPSGASQTEPDPVLPASYAQLQNGTILAAELLTINTIGFSVTEKLQ
jgi:hypothetical protein